MGNINPNVFGNGSFADIENEVKKLYGCSSRKRLHPLDRMGDPASKPAIIKSKALKINRQILNVE
ncbi:hypothetical protein [Methanococcoides seepicolus]|jgi:hypothetical protein|uniref:Uncharacterized protein n=1 Tax=Methanococcoides seepicolus TaxID=2828780 RepID=A0A9E4ZFA8_9EURY|nr:hypothetical protein [Methanococcoides seepicolus]MCM1986835.1 hypothetical protein [Methanococcoides seepicolus]